MGTILAYWCQRLNLVIEPADIAREQQRVLESRHGKSKLAPEDIWPLLRRDTELLFVAPPQVGLVSLYHADPEAGERAYQKNFADLLPEEVWRQLKETAKTGEAFRAFAAPLVAADLTRSARETAKQDLQKKALVKELKARGAIRSPDDLRQWLQGELAHVTAARLDVVALFVSRPDGQFIPGVPRATTGPGIRLELPVPPPAPARPDGREKDPRVPRWSEEGAHDIPLDEVPPYEEVRPQEFEEPERKRDPRSPAESGKRGHKEKPRRGESKAPPREPGNDVPPGVIENLPFEFEKPEDFQKPKEEQ
jgi:hypothetical protein